MKKASFLLLIAFIMLIEISIFLTLIKKSKEQEVNNPEAMMEFSNEFTFPY